MSNTTPYASTERAQGSKYSASSQPPHGRHASPWILVPACPFLLPWDATAWLTVVGVDLKTIGIFSLVGVPYTIKFLWSPSWTALCHPGLEDAGLDRPLQLSLMCGVGLMGWLTPGYGPSMLAVLALIVAFASASQDIAIDAYRTDVLKEVERHRRSTFVVGYRAAMLIAGALALIMSTTSGGRIPISLWQQP